MCSTLRMIFIVVVFCYLIILLKKKTMHTFWLLLCMMNFFVIFGFYNTYNIPQINIVSRCMCKCLIRKTFTYICINTCIHLIPLILLLFSCITLFFGLRLINKCDYVYVYFFIVCSNILSHTCVCSFVLIHLAILGFLFLSNLDF